MQLQNDFEQQFALLTGYGPFPWQEKLYKELLAGQFRTSCPIPTGLGKTSIITIWLLALVHHVRNGTLNGFPRRLIYVVNRRTVVDQATNEAVALREALITHAGLQNIVSDLQSLQTKDSDTPFAISTLRGQFADNADWRDDQARPAIIVGTVDMIGSRLLFSGYGRGFKSRPLHAGFLGQDTLLVHDEAHLEPAFQKLIIAIEAEQKRRGDFGRFRVMELTATSRTAPDDENPLFTDMDKHHPEVERRIHAKKGVVFHPVDGEKKIADKVFQLAKVYRDSGQAILIFLRRLDDVKYVARSLRKMAPENNVEILTGTMRGWERDAFAKDSPVFARFVRNPVIEAQQGTAFLVCTSAGEVGVNISADHLICDLTPFDSMAQRLGRVNRFGNGDALIDIVHKKYDKPPRSNDTYFTTLDNSQSEDPNNRRDPISDEESRENGKTRKKTPFDSACAQTLLLFQQLPVREDQRGNASPAALATIPATERHSAFTPEPVILPTSDILFDSWALTTIRRPLPGRPPVAEWLHGVDAWEPPVTYVAWREEVACISDSLAEIYPPEDLLEDYPLKPHELLRDQRERVIDELKKIAAHYPEISAWLIGPDGNVEVHSLTGLVAGVTQKKPTITLSDCTVLLPPEAGGLKNGILDGDSPFEASERDTYDIADKWNDERNLPRRCRIWDDPKRPDGMRLIRTIETLTDSEGEDEHDDDATGRHCWYWYVRPRSADDDGSRTARVKQDLLPHRQAAEDFARRLVAQLNIKEPEASAIRLAALWHDLGKDRPIWQHSIGNFDYPQVVLAKPSHGMRTKKLSNYRHEFGALLDVMKHPDFRELSSDVQDLVLHLIAAHHGRARPHFPPDETFDHDRPQEITNVIARDIPRRFARLQRKYGRWGLAYLESLVRAADIMASQAGNETDNGDVASTPLKGGTL